MIEDKRLAEIEAANTRNKELYPEDREDMFEEIPELIAEVRRLKLREKGANGLFVMLAQGVDRCTAITLTANWLKGYKETP